jgi:dihydroorotate dehydrogenase
MMPAFSTTLAGIPFPSCLMNASGAWSGTHDELRDFKDAQGALRRGAKAVQIGSALMKEGPGVFAHIEQELSAERTTHAGGA